ncbi:MAG: MATE family efflux transporter [Synergistes sp.]|nr:MATE family efflux transporter [Synergistes sp.]
MKIIKSIANRLNDFRTVDLGDGRVMSVLVKLAIPSIAMCVFHTLFHLVDTIFISWLGEKHLLAISFTFTVQIGFIAIVEGVTNGVTALVGRCLGEDKEGLACRTAKAGMALAVILTFLWTPFLFKLPSNAFFMSIGAKDPEVLHLAWLYNMWTPPMFLLVSFGFIVCAIFSCQGDKLTPLISYAISNALNVFLDALFIFGFGWGITGAAAATFIGRACGICYLMYKLRTSSKIKVAILQMPHLYMMRLWRKIVAIGLPVTFSTGSVALGIGTMTKILAATYGGVSVAGWLVGSRVEDFAFTTLIGVNDALVPFLAFNYGRRSFERMKEGIRSALFMSSVMIFVICVIIFAVPHPIIHLFHPTKEVEDIAIQSLRLSVAAYFFVMYATIYNALFTAVGKTVYGLIIQTFRSLFVRITALWVLAHYLTIHWIWVFQPISYFASGAMTFFFARSLMKKLKKELRS